MKTKAIFALLLCSLFLISCRSVQVKDYAQEKPSLVLEEYLNGTLDAHGIFQDRSGKVTKRFHALIKASWNGPVGILDEDFTWSDGTKSKRIWTITKKSNSEYIGTASDVVGEAKGEVAGNALRWRYVLSLPVDGKAYHVDFDDWMYLMDDKVMLNKSIMSKWGFYLGEVTLSFTKREVKP